MQLIEEKKWIPKKRITTKVATLTDLLKFGMPEFGTILIGSGNKLIMVTDRCWSNRTRNLITRSNIHFDNYNGPIIYWFLKHLCVFFCVAAFNSLDRQSAPDIALPIPIKYANYLMNTNTFRVLSVF